MDVVVVVVCREAVLNLLSLLCP